MADSFVTLDPGAGGDDVAIDKIAGKDYQYVKLVDGTVDGTGKIGGDATNGLDVDVTRLPSLPAGTNAIGKLAANSGVDIGDVDVTSSALPTGAATSAKQPALGTAGTPSADVLSVQGVTSMTALKVDGSGVTQPVSGTVTASGPLTDTQLRASAVPVADGGGSLTVDGTVAVSGTVAVTDNSGSLTVDNGGTFAVQIAANSSINNAQVAGTAVSVNSGTKDAGTQRVILASDQTVVPVSDNAGSLTVDAPVGTPVFVTATPSTTGGWSKVKYAAQTTTVQTPKGTAASFGGYFAYNPNASVAYIQVFDAATATTITLGTTVPDMIFAIPAASAANLEITNGVNMANGTKLACTTTATGSTAPGTGLDLTIFFK